MAGSVNTFCIKGIIKLIIVLALIVILLIVGVGYLVNYLTLEKLGMADKKVFNDLSFKQLSLSDKSIVEIYKESKPFFKNKEYTNIYNAKAAETSFAENGINRALTEKIGIIDYSYIFTNVLTFNETKVLTLSEIEVIYLYRNYLSKLELFNSGSIKNDTLIGVEIIKAGGQGFLRLVFDWSFYLNNLDFNMKFLQPKKLYFGFYFALNIVEGKFSAELRSSSVNGVNGGLAEGIINAVMDEKTFDGYQNILKTAVVTPLNNLGKVGILENQVPLYGINGLENGKINLLTQKE